MTVMNTFYFEVMPRDTLFFRDARPMEKAMTNYIESMTVPYPSVFYGMMCSALMEKGQLKEVKAKLEEMGKSDKSTGSSRNGTSLEECLKNSLELCDIFIISGGELYIPAPLDLFEGESKRVYAGVYEDGLLYPPDQYREETETVQGKFIRLFDFIHCYAKENFRGIQLHDEQEFFHRYGKAGLEIEKERRKAKEAHLYFAEMLEPKKDTGYLLKVRADIPEESLETKKGLWKSDALIGGRNRVAYIRQVKEGMSYLKQEKEYWDKKCRSKRIKMIFKTPYIIDERFSEKMSETEIKVLTRVAGKQMSAGGFDMARGRQKELKTAMPPGSLFLLESERFTDMTLNEIKELIDGAIGCTEGQQFRGFGRFIISEAD